jgi:leader peptidase (prepilin peptidase)/N-methyltransferase
MLLGLPRAVAVPAVLLFAAVVLVHHGDGAEIVLGLALATFLVAAGPIEIQGGRLPDRLLAAAAATAVGLGMLLDSGGQVERLLSALAASGFILLVALAWPGSSDIDAVKLAAVLGLFLGRDVAAAVLFTVGAMIIVALARAAAGDERTQAWRARARIGALLVIGAVGALVFGEPLVAAYLAAF